ncbi:MAG: phosphate/phosphite/phosphonate ABC transporter substrate-binding protein [Desulfosarcinaceae bacterium]|nr:phosphate/phosphite/phosphonate ABC transporter substrate-binding protein [Desulfosarcinaceae bacterium]
MNAHMPRRWPAPLAAFLLFLAAVTAVPGYSQAAASSVGSASYPREQVLVIGKVTENPKKHYDTLKPMVDYAAGHMKDLGIRATKVLMARDNRQMISYLRQGKIDWVTETCFSAVVLQEKTGAEILLRKWKKGVPEYHTVFFTRRDSGIDSLAHLRGRTIAFEDPGSTSAFFIPAWLLLRHGYELVPLGSVRDTPAAEMVGYVFSEKEENSSTWVHRGLVELAAVSNTDWEKGERITRVQRETMKIIHRSKPYPRAVEIVREDLNPAIKRRLKLILLEADKDPKAVPVLKSYQKTKKFDELDDRGWAALAEARQIIDHVKAGLD